MISSDKLWVEAIALENSIFAGFCVLLINLKFYSLECARFLVAVIIYYSLLCIFKPFTIFTILCAIGGLCLIIPMCVTSVKDSMHQAMEKICTKPAFCP